MLSSHGHSYETIHQGLTSKNCAHNETVEIDLFGPHMVDTLTKIKVITPQELLMSAIRSYAEEYNRKNDHPLKPQLNSNKD